MKLLPLFLLPLAATAQQRYNIVYIMTDDHTAQMMSPMTTVMLKRLTSTALLPMV